jgi:hypothetical protein
MPWLWIDLIRECAGYWLAWCDEVEIELGR